MRAQNEPPERVVRLNARRRGPVGGGEPDPEIPGALRVERMEDCDLAAGFVWPQSRGSQLAGLAVGRAARRARARPLRRARREGDAARRERREVVAVEKHPGRARELEANCKLSGRDERARRQRRRARAPGRPRRVRPRARRRAVLRPRRARRAARPALAGQAAARAPARPAARGRRARAAGRRGRLLGLHDQRGRERGDRRRERPRARRARRGVAAVRAPRRPEFLLTLPHRDRTSGFFIARLRSSAG